MRTSTQADDAESTRRTVDRRAVMRAVGAAGLGAAWLRVSTGTAAAGETPDQLYFCGCSQLVVTGLNGDSGGITVYLRATDEGACATKQVTEPDCRAGYDPEGNNLNYAFRYTVEDEEAILAVESPDGNVWCNPNNCAQKWLDELTCFSENGDTLRDACTDRSVLDEPGDVFTNKCGTVCSGGNGGPPNGEPERSNRGGGPPN